MLHIKRLFIKIDKLSQLFQELQFDGPPENRKTSSQLVSSCGQHDALCKRVKPDDNAQISKPQPFPRTQLFTYLSIPNLHLSDYKVIISLPLVF